MDYERIYRDFIADRCMTEATLVGYRERHHILPRSLQGGNEPDNLIDLTPEDHFFAHLLLAKIHRGKMSAALFCMLQVSPNHWGRRHHARGLYGLAKRLALPALAEAWTGESNPLFNPEEWDWVNRRTGERIRATLFDMHRRSGGSRPHWTNVALGNRPSYRGWVRADRLEGIAHSEKGQPFSFVNRDGRTCTQGAFAKAHGVNLATASRVVRHQSVSRCGWRLQGVKDRPHSYAKDGLPARTQRAGATAT